MKQNWKGACEMLLRSSIGENDQERKDKICELAIEEGKVDEALRLLERRDRIERAILEGLKKHKNGYYNAFQNIS